MPALPPHGVCVYVCEYVSKWTETPMGSLSPSDPSPVSFRTSGSETLSASESRGKLGKAKFSGSIFGDSGMHLGTYTSLGDADGPGPCTILL